MKITKSQSLIITILLLLVVYFVYTNKPQSNLQTYKNTDYNFTISYPKNLTPEFTFKTYPYYLSLLDIEPSYPYLLDGWRTDAIPQTKGKGIITIPIYGFVQENAYNNVYKNPNFSHVYIRS